MTARAGRACTSAFRGLCIALCGLPLALAVPAGAGGRARGERARDRAPHAAAARARRARPQAADGHGERRAHGCRVVRLAPLPGAAEPRPGALRDAPARRGAGRSGRAPLPRGARRARPARPGRRGRAHRAAARRRGGLPGRDVPPADRHGAGARRRRPAVGRRSLDGRSGHQGRRDRRRRGCRRGVPRTRGPASARGLPARPAPLHERPRDRRAQLRRQGRAGSPTTSPSTR